jgi:hypothetical protein
MDSTDITTAGMESRHCFAAITGRRRGCQMVQFGKSRHIRQLWRAQQSQAVTVTLDYLYGYAHELTPSSKSMTVALATGDVTAARAAYHQMSENGKSAVMTQYLMYKIALQENDVELGKQLPLTHQAHS